MLRRTSSPSSTLPVLLLGDVGIEFLDSDGRFHRSKMELEPGAGAAEQAAEFLRSIDATPGPCILALSEPFAIN